MDNVRNPDTGHILPWADELIRQLNSYTEISRSNSGIHIFLYGQAPLLENEKLRCKASNILGTCPDFEIFFKNKFATITGNILVDQPIRQVAKNEILQIYRMFFPKDTFEDISAQKLENSPSMTNEELLERARHAKNGRRFSDLYDRGSWNSRYSSASEADMALTGMLAFYSQKEEQLIELLMASALYREKWKERENYLPTLVQKVLSTAQGTFQSPSIRIKILAKEILKEENPCKDFSLGLFPSCVKEYVCSITEHCEAHPITTLGSVLSITSSYGSRCYVDYFRKLFPNTYQLNLKASGGGKSTALNKGAHYALIREQEIAKDLKIRIDNAAAQESKKDEQKQIKEALKQRANLSRLMPSRTTAQRLFTDLGNGHRGVVLLSEFSGWLDDLEVNYNATIKVTLTELYDCPEFFEVRLKSNIQAPEILINPFFGIMGVCTPEWIEGKLKSEDIFKGFLARFLLFWIKDKPKKPRALSGSKWVPPESLKNALEKAEQFEGEYFLREEAEIVFVMIYDYLWDSLLTDFPLEEQFAIIEPFLKRWILSILKIALAFHLLEEPENRNIAARHVQAGAYYVGFAISSTLHILKSGLFGSQFDRDCQSVIKFFAERGGSVMRKDILKAKRLKQGRKYAGVQTYDDILDFLLESGQLAVKECQAKSKRTYRLSVEKGSGK